MIWIYSFFIIFIILYFYFSFYKENLTNINNKKIILIGDSILENSSYANPSILDILEKSFSVLCLAQDNATIDSAYLQIYDIPSSLNNKNTFIFISIGGNDILKKYVYKDIESNKTTNINNLFNEYKSFILSLKTKMIESNIILLNIYFPYESYYKQYYTIIKEWNVLIKDFCLKNNFKLLNIAGFMTTKQDFSFDIEPSSIGSQKISQSIIKSL